MPPLHTAPTPKQLAGLQTATHTQSLAWEEQLQSSTLLFPKPWVQADLGAWYQPEQTPRQPHNLLPVFTPAPACFLPAYAEVETALGKTLNSTQPLVLWGSQYQTVRDLSGPTQVQQRGYLPSAKQDDTGHAKRQGTSSLLWLLLTCFGSGMRRGIYIRTLLRSGL